MKKFFRKLFVCFLLLASAWVLCSCTFRTVSFDDEEETPISGEAPSSVQDYGSTAPAGCNYGSVTPEKRDDGRTVICIDAGHGFEDVGCQSPYGFDEKDITLDISNKLKKYLESGGASVVMTHDGTEYPSFERIVSAADALGIKYDKEKVKDNGVFGAYERSVWLNVLDAENYFDLFVSVHVNSIEDHPEVSGFSIDYYEGSPAADFLRELTGSVGGMLEDEFSAEVRIFEDVYEEAYIVNKYTDVPSVLIECGYATNRGDATNLKSEEWRESFAESLAKTLLDALNK